MVDMDVDKTQKKLKADQAPDRGRTGGTKTTWDATLGRQSYSDGSVIDIDGWR